MKVQSSGATGPKVKISGPSEGNGRREEALGIWRTGN